MFQDGSFYTQRFLSSEACLFIGIDHLPLFRGPVDHHRFANDILNWQELPLMGIPGVITIISKNEQLALGHDPIAIISRRAGNIRFSAGSIY
jgi:hypothetical protein